MLDLLFYCFLGLFLLLTGIAAVTNIVVVWMDPVTGICALVAGILCCVIAFKRMS